MNFIIQWNNIFIKRAAHNFIGNSQLYKNGLIEVSKNIFFKVLIEKKNYFFLIYPNVHIIMYIKRITIYN